MLKKPHESPLALRFPLRGSPRYAVRCAHIRHLTNGLRGALLGPFGMRRRRVREAPGLWAILLGLILQILLLSALILDHSKSEYMLLVAAVVPVLPAVIPMVFEYDRRTRQILNRTLTALLLVGLVVALGMPWGSSA